MANSRIDKRKNVKRLLQSVREVLLREWDPIGVKDEPCAQSEYDSYAPPICTLLLQSASIQEISEYLLLMETERMGLSGDTNRAKLAATKLIGLANP